MARQANGITVVQVVDDGQWLRLLEGAGDFRLKWNPTKDRLEDAGRWWLDGRRGAAPRMTRAAWKQAYAIARDHGWKKSTRP